MQKIIQFPKKTETAWEDPFRIKAPLGENIMRVSFFHHKILCWVIVKDDVFGENRAAFAIFESVANDNSNYQMAKRLTILSQKQLEHADILDEFDNVEEKFEVFCKEYEYFESLKNSMDRITMTRVLLNIEKEKIKHKDQLGMFRALKNAIKIRDQIRSTFIDPETLKNAKPILE